MRFGFTFVLVALAAPGGESARAADEDPFRGIQAGEEVIHVLRSRFGLGPAASAPSRTSGIGPFARLVIRGATLVDGTGALPVGPVDIVVERDRIAEIRSVGFPGALIVGENPLANFKVLYGTGAFALDDETGQGTHIGGISTIVKDGIVFDVPSLLSDVRAMVAAARSAEAAP